MMAISAYYAVPFLYICFIYTNLFYGNLLSKHQIFKTSILLQEDSCQQNLNEVEALQHFCSIEEHIIYYWRYFWCVISLMRPLLEL